LTRENLYGILDGMKAIPYTTAREKLASTMDDVVANHAPVIITRNGSGSVVMLSLEDFESMEETAYLMSSPVNAARLNEAIRALESGEGVITRDAADFLGK
jgi:antitoxin YefM